MRTSAGEGLPEQLLAATPRSRLWLSVALAWIGVGSTAALFVVVGAIIDSRRLDGVMVALAVVLAVVSAGALGIGSWFAPWSAAEAERRLRRSALARIFRRNPIDVETQSGELLALVTGSIQRVAHYRSVFLGPMIGALTTPFLVLIIMAVFIDPATAGWIALLVLSVPILVGGFQRMVRPIGTAYRVAQARLTAAFLEAIQGLGTLVLARAGWRKAADLEDAGEDYRRRLMGLLAGNQIIIFIIDIAFSLSVMVVAAVSTISRVNAGVLSMGAAAAIMLMTTLVVGPVDVVGQFFYIGIGGRAAQRALARLLQDSESDTVDGASAGAGTPAPAVADASTRPAESDAAITLENVTAGWTPSTPVITDFSLHVDAGERVALIGPSGVGKSTVAALIQAFLTPTSGHIIVDGLDTQRADPDLIRSRLAVVEQRTYLFQGTIAENLSIAAPDATTEELVAALEFAGLRDDVNAMPAGLATRVGEHGLSLSGGQAQRLAIARAVLRNAPILILDEPTSQVDLGAEAAILAALERAAHGRTVLMITHRPGAIFAADRVVDMTAVKGAV